MHRFDPARLSRFDAWMNAYVDSGKLPGCSVLLAQGGEILHRGVAGLASVEEGTPYRDDTIARIYSMTKPVTSVVLMMLAERGLLHLAAPVSDYIPEFADMEVLIDGAKRLDQIRPCATPTLAQLATHTAGLTYSFNPGPLGAVYKERVLDFPAFQPAGLEGAVKMVADLPLAFEPGSQWGYSVGIDVLGRVIEVVAGKPLDQVFSEFVFEPLGMTDTGFGVSDAQLDRFAWLYTAIDPANPTALGAKGTGELHKIDNAENSPYRSPITFGGGGGLVSTLDDYFAFCEMLRKGGAHNGARILSPSTLKFMRRNFLPGDIASMGAKSFAEMPMEGIGFGIGWSVVLEPGRTLMPSNVGDFSWGGIASTVFWVDPVEDLVCIFFTQVTPSSAYPIRHQLKSLVHGAMI